MHAGSIRGSSAAGRVYRYLRDRAGQWIDGWTLTLECRVTAVGTRVSEIRSQLDGTGYAVEYAQRGGGHYYRLVPVGQMSLLEERI